MTKLINDLIDLRNCVMDMLMNVTILQAHRDNGVKLYNPHCVSWKKCYKKGHDCFYCDLNSKGSEQYIIEKLSDDVIKTIIERWGNEF